MNLKKRCSTLLVCAVTLASLAIANLPSLTVSAQEPTEIVSKRTAYEKHYDNHDGTTTALIHSTPLHYLDDGEWRDINNTLMPGQDNNYVNTSNSMKVSLPKSTQLKTYSDNQTNDMFQMNYNGYTLSWVMMDISSEYSAIKNIPEPCILNEQKYSISLKNRNVGHKVKDSIGELTSSAMYQSVYPYVDVKLDIMAQTVKETLILNNPKAHSAEFSYFIAAKGLTARLIEDNMVIFVNKDEETVFTIPPAYMFDSSETEEICFNIDTKIVSYNDGYLLTYLPDQNWIHSDERVFPVMLDPTIITTIKTASDSAYISEENPNVRYTDNFLKMGGSYGNRFESFISFPVNYANFSNTAEIKEATCSLMFLSHSRPESGTGDMPRIDVGLIQEPPIAQIWSQAAVDTISHADLSSFTLDENQIGLQEFDLTKHTQLWLNYAQTGHQTGCPDFGFKLLSHNNGNNYRVLRAYSTRLPLYAPYLEIRYTTSSPYTFDYAPAKYNTITATSTSSEILNFQKRMNCYAYALQVYYSGTLENDSAYQLCPGEFGIRYNSHANNYAELRDTYSNFQCADVTYMDFIEERMSEDCTALGCEMERISTHDGFSLPSSFNENSERIIAMVVGEGSWTHILSPHYYARNGSGTCPNNHGDACSGWSHKIGAGKVFSTAIEQDYYEYKYPSLCDQNIHNHAAEGDYSSSPEVRYYTITKNVHLYNSWHGNGHFDASTGTPYRPQ